MLEKESSPLLSVIIPVYKVEQYFEQCLESVIHQTYQRLDIIVIINSTEDHCIDIAREYEKCDPRVKIIVEERKGVSYARNTALNIAKGDIITFVDADDWLDKDIYTKMIDLLLIQDVEMVACMYSKEFFDGSHIIKESILNGRYNRIETLKESMRHTGYQAMIWNKIFLREVIFKNGLPHLFDTTLTNGEDSLWCQKVISNINYAYLDNAARYHYRIRSDGANFSGVISYDRIGEIRSYFKSNEFLEKIDSELVFYNLGRIFDKSCEMYINAYIQKKRDRFDELKSFLKLSRRSFLKSKEYPLKMKLYYFFMEILINLHFSSKLIDLLRRVTLNIYLKNKCVNGTR